MADYIDREAFLAFLKSKEYSMASIKTIREYPAADVCPVKHCKWTCIDEIAGVYNCSYCDGYYLVVEGTLADNSINYCQHCGAKLAK